MNILDRLIEWKSKGELCYLGKASGLSWKDIEGVCFGGRVSAMRWAKRHGKAWPVGGVAVTAVEESGVVNAGKSVEEVLSGPDPSESRLEMLLRVKREYEEFAYEIEDLDSLLMFYKGEGLSVSKSEAKEVLDLCLKEVEG